MDVLHPAEELRQSLQMVSWFLTANRNSPLCRPGAGLRLIQLSSETLSAPAAVSLDQRRYELHEIWHLMRSSVLKRFSDS